MTERIDPDRPGRRFSQVEERIAGVNDRIGTLDDRVPRRAVRSAGSKAPADPPHRPPSTGP